MKSHTVVSVMTSHSVCTDGCAEGTLLPASAELVD
uniref:Uncharacterized protein n=1 Tax=Anguilla anguilla TaxID=7936 RepID=A0A0E9XXK9_ANGAN